MSDFDTMTMLDAVIDSGVLLDDLRSTLLELKRTSSPLRRRHRKRLQGSRIALKKVGADGTALASPA